MKYVHIVDDFPASEDGEGQVLIVCLDGFLDAGRSASLLTTHLADEAPRPIVASFDIDAFHDYRARRPGVTFTENHYHDYDAPRIVVRQMLDANDVPYLMMTGPEPDMRWEAFAEGVAEVVTRLGVRLVLTLDSVPMAAPHTRPLMVTRHANMPDRRSDVSHWSGSLRVPASVQALLAIRLGERDLPLQGFVLHVPHYRAQFDFNDGALALAREVTTELGLVFNTNAIRLEAEADDERYREYVAGHPELASLVTGLEEQYDRFQFAEASGLNLLPGEELPDGEQLGAEFQRFLAGLDERGPDN
ncbi:proteasome assembly chaperone family protein [Nocardioides sp. Bht2]|uniref:proteasome assembly chaperone family protein n=1 Tax=Nocardioides sp. Bht2 TaxID=3392297 RepID=UPI0039B490F3